ncbi:MAG: hypothetical protein KF754_00085 [Planctomycetes bacterium]|nr:hypothetical protein [Planctomycetota bacterium]
MDALSSQVGIIEGRTDITKAEVYLRGKPGTFLVEATIRQLVEGDFGYTLRSFTRLETDWAEYFKPAGR